MAPLPYMMEILLFFICFFFLCHWRRNRNSPITNWPVLGMLPGLLWNISRLHEYVTKILNQNGGTFLFKGPWFSDLEFVFTSDPANTHYILSKNFANFPKGPDFREIFYPFGEGVLVADSDSWKFQRRMTQWFLKHSKFLLFLERTIQEKVAKSLVPVLDHVSSQEVEVDMQDVFQRMNFDIICSLVLGCDPNCLSVEFPQVPYEKAFNDMEEAVLYRHVVPESYWKLQRWLQIGQEKKLSTACKTLDSFIYQCISVKKDEYLKSRSQMEEDREEAETNFDFLTAYLMEEEALKEWDSGGITESEKFLRDAASNLLVAGRDTTSAAISWFFWLIGTNKSVESKILEEIKEKLHQAKDGKQGIFSAEEVNKLVYLHAALCETLRLCPSVPINHKASLLPDTLPSGLRIDANTKMFISFYSMGRMEGIWGKDCLEFKPERWITGHGEIVHAPSYKFTAFNAGPRSCLGKDMSFTQMKLVAVSILHNYQIQVVEGQCVTPSNSIVLHMKHGLKVRVAKRCLV